MEIVSPSTKVEYFLTNPYTAESRTSVYKETQPISELDKEIEPPKTHTSPLLSDFTTKYLPPPHPPSDSSTSTEVTTITAIIGAVLTDVQLQAIITAAM